MSSGVPPDAFAGVVLPCRLKLIITAGPCLGGKGLDLQPDSRAIIIGRNKLRTTQPQAVLKDVGISERHAEATCSGITWKLRDTGSSNGTVLNGVRLESNGDWSELRDGDKLQLGLDTHATVQIVPCSLDNVTVEQLLRLQADLTGQAYQVEAHAICHALLHEVAEMKRAEIAA